MRSRLHRRFDEVSFDESVASSRHAASKAFPFHHDLSSDKGGPAVAAEPVFTRHYWFGRVIITRIAADITDICCCS